MWKLNTPVALFIFNRPETTQRVFEVIRAVQPPILFIIADGIRPDKPEDRENCAATQAIVAEIDWDCKVVQNYAPENLGCGRRIATGISWVFEQVETAIFLEDDCLANPSFFRFCEELLNQYKDHLNVTQICGHNRLDRWRWQKQSYHFSYYGSSWGWACWQRSWQYYDYYMRQWQDVNVREAIAELLADSQQFEYLAMRCQQTLDRLDTWDYQWSLAQLAQGGLSIIPAVNLVTHLGVGQTASHTKTPGILQMSQRNYPMDFPLQHHQDVTVDRDYMNRHFSWSIGQPDPDTLIPVIARLLEMNRKTYALMALQQALKSHPQHPELQRYQQMILANLREK